MKTETYIVEIEMPDGDGASPLWVKDVLQSDADIEDDGRWKVSVKDNWKPTEEQIKSLEQAARYYNAGEIGLVGKHLTEILEQFKEL